MHNTRIITNEFELFQPGSLTEIWEHLDNSRVETILMAGGTDVLPQMKEGRKAPKKVVSTMKVPELDFIEIKDKVLRIGAGTRLKKIAEACKDIPSIAALYQGVASIGKLQILSMATIAGNICTASPAADSVPALLVLGAWLILKSANGEREIPLKDFLLGPGKTAIKPGEIVYSVNLTVPGEDVFSRFGKMERVGADIAKINMAVLVRKNGNTCETCKVAVGSCGPTTMLIPGTDEILGGQAIDDPQGALVRKAGASVAATITPIDDVRSTAEYRRKVASVMFRDSFKAIWKNA